MQELPDGDPDVFSAANQPATPNGNPLVPEWRATPYAHARPEGDAGAEDEAGAHQQWLVWVQSQQQCRNLHVHVQRLWWGRGNLHSIIIGTLEMRECSISFRKWLQLEIFRFTHVYFFMSNTEKYTFYTKTFKSAEQNDCERFKIVVI